MAYHEEDFHVGDSVVLCNPTASNDGGWGSGMYLYVGEVGVIEDADCGTLKYKVRFSTKTKWDDAEEREVNVRNFWFCKAAWLERYSPIEPESKELDSMFSEFS